MSTSTFTVSFSDQTKNLSQAIKNNWMAAVLVVVIIVWFLIFMGWTEPYKYQYMRYFKGEKVKAFCDKYTYTVDANGKVTYVVDEKHKLPENSELGTPPASKSGMSPIGKSIRDDGRMVQTSFCTTPVLYDGQTGAEARGAANQFYQTSKSGFSDSDLRHRLTQ